MTDFATLALAVVLGTIVGRGLSDWIKGWFR